MPTLNEHVLLESLEAGKIAAIFTRGNGVYTKQNES